MDGYVCVCVCLKGGRKGRMRDWIVGFVKVVCVNSIVGGEVKNAKSKLEARV
jgi:hypothetical protein